MKYFISYILSLFLILSVSAQNRIIVNAGFNNGNNLPSSGWSLVESQKVENHEIDGWYTTHPSYNGYISPIEIWTDGFLNTPAQEGTHFVELNAAYPSRLYQIVYLINGENINWGYYHRNRPGGLATQTIKYSIYNQDGSLELYVIDTYDNTNTSSWTHRQGTFNVSLNTGIYQIGFESTTGTSYGNLLDNVTIDLEPLIEFTETNPQSTETEGTSPYLTINGKVTNNSTVTISIDNATASNPDDYTYSNLTINIPPGEYSLADSIEIPFNIINDNNVEGDETIELSITGVTGDLLQQDADGSSNNENTCTYTIIDDDVLSANITKLNIKSYNKTTTNIIIWETSTENNSNYFDIERSTDYTKWIRIGEVIAAGNSNEILHYNFIDKNPKIGLNIYRLKQVDYNNDFIYSKNISFYNNPTVKLKIYPNPINNQYLNIESQSNADIYIYNSNGTQIKVNYTSQKNKYIINLPILKAGIYYIKQNNLLHKFIVL